MKRVVIIAILVAGVLAVAMPVMAKGGSAKACDVWWEEAGGVQKALFYTTGSGIVHEWRYDPIDAHLVFKPQSRFPEPDEPGWFSWQYTAQYGQDTAWDDDCDLEDFFDPNAWYWVNITWQ